MIPAFLITVLTQVWQVWPVCLTMAFVPAFFMAYLTYTSIEGERLSKLYIERVMRKLTSKKDESNGRNPTGGSGA